MKTMLAEDLETIHQHIEGRIDELSNTRILVTGACGFLGYNIIHYLVWLNQTKKVQNMDVICLDMLIRGMPNWMESFVADNAVQFINSSINNVNLEEHGPFNYIIHAASIASPKFYRKHPIETMDANVIGLRNVIEYAKKAGVTSVLNFSSSEIYGDPDPDNIPTKEDYRGLVSCTGPRACYDESKRYGETLCVNFHQQYGTPIKIVRPFNNYGPGLKLEDARVLPDFCKNIFEKKDIVLLSDGKPTRTFCYVADAIGGYLLALLSQHNASPFNIGNPSPEISMLELARKVVEISEDILDIDRKTEVIYQNSEEKDYLTDNPNRRCPDITKAQELLGYQPKVSLDEGIKRTLLWYKGYYQL